MMNRSKVSLANLPTPIQKLENRSKRYRSEIYVKRDDFTGSEVSGNKIRKLEYCLEEAIRSGCNTIITRGAVQSNHCRATASACARLGLACHLLLKGDAPENPEGNYFFDHLLGARIHHVKPDQVDETAAALKKMLEDQGNSVYEMPVGASTAVGAMGYGECMEEIYRQESEMGIFFDTIVVAVGSGGTYAGLVYQNALQSGNRKIIGYAVDQSTDYFTQVVSELINRLNRINKNTVTPEIQIRDHSVGKGYAIATDEELLFYQKIAAEEGMILDPCYTGKAFYGMIRDVESGSLDDASNILFIHTGGVMGWTEVDRLRMMEFL